MYNYGLLVDTTERLCIQVGRGQGDRTLGGMCGDLGLGTWDLRTQDEGLGDIKYGTPGPVGRGHETSNTGMQGTWGHLLQKSEVNAISLSS